MIKRIVALCLLTAVLFTGCVNMSINDNKKSVLTTTVSQINLDTNGHIEQLCEYDTPYTICYRNNDDTYSMFIFSSPIQYKTDTGYKIIDNTMVESKKEGFAYENKANEVNTYFPKTPSETFRVEKGANYLEFRLNQNTEGLADAKETIFTNMYGDQVSAVIYEHTDMDMVLYSTRAGIKME